MFTLQSGFNAFNPERFLYDYVMNEAQLDQALHEIETMGQGFSNYKFPAQDYVQSDTPTITYMGIEQAIWYLDK